MRYAGQCLCGGASYAAEADPIFAGHCFCRDCQRESGTSHITGVAVPAAALTTHGEVRRYTKASDSGGSLTTTFCPTCGNALYHEASKLPGVVIIRAGTLDEGAIEPQLSMYAASAPAWERPSADLVAFDAMPPA